MPHYLVRKTALIEADNEIAAAEKCLTQLFESDSVELQVTFDRETSRRITISGERRDEIAGAVKTNRWNVARATAEDGGPGTGSGTQRIDSPDFASRGERCFPYSAALAVFGMLGCFVTLALVMGA